MSTPSCGPRPSPHSRCPRSPGNPVPAEPPHRCSTCSTASSGARGGTASWAAISAHRDGYPPNWRRFLAAVDAISVPAYVDRIADPQLTDLLATAHDLYAGHEGFLGRHRRKVFGYLETAFKVGRGVTIGGFTGTLQDRPWQRVDHELEQARAERAPRSGTSPHGRRTTGGMPTDSYRVSDLVLHNDDGHGYWIGVAGCLYDVTALLRRHPGGPIPLEAYAGRDATAVYRQLHGSSDAADRLRRDHRIGVLRPVMPPATTGERDGAHAARRLADAWVQTLDLVVEMQNAVRHDLTLRRAVGPGRLPENPGSPYLLERHVDAQQRFLHHYLRQVTVTAAATLWEVTARSGALDLPVSWMRTAMDAVWAAPAGRRALAVPDLLRAEITTRVAATPGDGTRTQPTSRPPAGGLERQALAFLQDLKLVIRDGVVHFEEQRERVLETRGEQLTALCRRLPVLLAGLLHRIASGAGVVASDDTGSSPV
jgi:cytochrome b involved in lipid metabolism